MTARRGVSTLHTDASGTAPPDTFGPFRVLHQIGAGVLGPVYRAYQPDPGRLVAVKLFRIDLQPENAHRFVAALERLIAADLTHLGIAAPLAAGLSENSPYLALDFVAAESFDVVIRDYGPAPVTEALRIAAQLGGALDFAAAVNVFHGALHPRDVLVSTDDTRVTGLGITQALEQVGFTPPIRRPYTAPERLAGAAWDRRADVFSLAALVYEMLFGKRIAGAGRDAADAIPAIDGADQGQLKLLFARALAEDPADRFETALAFVEALHATFGASASPRPSPPARTASKPRPRRTEPKAPRDAGAQLPLAADPADLPLAGPVDTRAEAGVPPAPAPETQAFSDLELRAAEEERFTLADTIGAAPETIVDPVRESPAVAPPAPVIASHAEERPAADPDLPVRAPRVEIAPALETHDAPYVDEHPSLSSVAIEQSRSAVWPIVLALVMGLSIGFAFGFSYGSRDRNQPSQSAAAEATRPVPSESVQEPPIVMPPATSDGSSRQTTPAPPPGAPRQAQPPQPAPSASRPAPAVAPPPAPSAPASRGGTPAAAPRAEPSRSARAGADAGRVLVRSTPAGARVSIDGRDAGVTPLTIRDVSPGAHVVRIAHQGYVSAERRVRIGTAQPAQSIEVDLVARGGREAAPAPQAAPDRTSGSPAAAPGAKAGSLMVDSRPGGARVFVDGRLVGTTPLLIDAVAAGDHPVRLELGGFKPWVSSVRISSGERARVSGSLEQE